MTISPESFSHYKTGIKSIDDEHYALLTEIDNVVSQIKSNSPLAAANTKAFIAKLLKHTSNEERQMRAVNYPYVMFHLDDHQKIALIIEQLLAHDHAANTIVFYIFLEKLQHMLLTHIDNYDLQFAAWVTEKHLDLHAV